LLICPYNEIVELSFATKVMAQPQPTTTPKFEEPKFGFNTYAERLNGRAAMIGFVATLAIEYVTGQGLLAWLGLV
jgi:Chlorophyll A-B binding protein